jgi:hypothetical protein
MPAEKPTWMDRMRGRRAAFDEWARKPKPGARALAKGVAVGVGGLGLGYGGSLTLDAWRHRNDPPSLADSMYSDADGTFVRTPGGGLVWVPNNDYTGNPSTLEEPPTAEDKAKQAARDKMWDSLTSPWLVLALFGGLIAYKTLGSKK